MKNIFDWFVKSSADPEKISLTLKAGIPLLVFLGADKLVGTTDLSGIFDTVATVVAALGTLISGFLTLYGFVRKITLTYRKSPETKNIQ